MPLDTLLARQPIFNKKMEVYAYELLFRNEQSLNTADLDGDRASSEVILNAFSATPINTILDGKSAFINFTRNLLLKPPELDTHQVVIEVMEDIELDEEIIEALNLLKQQGFTIALDDFSYIPGADKALDIADLVKLDVLALNNEELKQHTQLCRNHQCMILAEKVENQPMFKTCKDLGFDYFQGYFFSKPEIIKGKKLASNQKSVIDLLTKLQDPDVEIDEVIAIIATEPTLSIKLLRIINSSMFGFSSEVKSIGHAVSLLGLQHIRTWVSMLALTDGTQKPEALILQTLTRARFCQLFSQHISTDEKEEEQYFTAGIFSSMDAFLDMPLEDLFEGISLSGDIQSAILNYRGTLGLSLHTAIACERGLWAKLHWPGLKRQNITPKHLQKWAFEAIDWAQQILDSLFEKT